MSFSALLAGVLACGPAPAIDLGTDFSPEDIEANLNGQEEEEAAPNDLVPPVSGSFPGQAVSPACEPGFQACGGLLSGLWIAEETCNSLTRNRKALQIWGQTIMNLATAECSDAVQSVNSRWEGELSFARGVAIDTRTRHDMIEMNLSRSCLNATFGVNIDAEKIPAVCATLSRGSTFCTAVGDMCACSNRREAEVSRSGVYGVLGTSVAIGTTPGKESEFFDYCVQSDTLLWQEPTSEHFVILRRAGAATVSADPAYVR
ncbi:MAG: hypothetical protein RL033_3341 [Pseudomonadota bacterium]|jgi:hypothetical protein